MTILYIYLGVFNRVEVLSEGACLFLYELYASGFFHKIFLRCVSRYEFKWDFKIAMAPFYFAATATLRQPTILFIKKDRIEYSKSICQSRAFGFCIKITLFRSMNLAQISSSQYKCKKQQTKISIFSKLSK